MIDKFRAHLYRFGEHHRVVVFIHVVAVISQVSTFCLLPMTLVNVRKMAPLVRPRSESQFGQHKHDDNGQDHHPKYPQVQQHPSQPPLALRHPSQSAYPS
jgi:hypothetical protein